MTINEKIYYQLPDLIKMYRFEGGNSVHRFSFNENGINPDDLNYIYFSKSIKHHEYYVKKKIIKIINDDILENYSNLKLDHTAFLKPDSFKKIIKVIENHPLDNKTFSIEFSLSQTFNELLKNNHINNRNKKALDRRIEVVDTTKYKGGLGFCDEWLEVFNIFTYFYSYQRITKENILDFLYAYRKIITEGAKIDPTGFLLNRKNCVIKVNEKIYYDFMKYELMNALQNIVDNNLYFEKSILDENPQEQIKKIIKKYCNEREMILELYESEYQKTLKLQ
jgi:hypothetical protein